VVLFKELQRSQGLDRLFISTGQPWTQVSESPLDLRWWSQLLKTRPQLGRVHH
jgi:hypothetical protein